jgi:hypothetical protein
VNRAQGKFSFNYGGAFFSNVLSASVDYQYYFLPGVVGRSPFEQVLSTSITVRLPHSSSAQAKGDVL